MGKQIVQSVSADHVPEGWHKITDLPSERGASRLIMEELLDHLGINPATVPDCTLDERLEVPSGRGVMLMRTFMTRIEYSAAGNSVLLEKIRDQT